MWEIVIYVAIGLVVIAAGIKIKQWFDADVIAFKKGLYVKQLRKLRFVLPEKEYKSISTYCLSLPLERPGLMSDAILMTQRKILEDDVFGQVMRAVYNKFICTPASGLANYHRLELFYAFSGIDNPQLFDELVADPVLTSILYFRLANSINHPNHPNTVSIGI